MKIRIKGNSVRLRLTKTDVRSLGTAGVVSDKTSFGTAVFTYQLQLSSNQNDMNASFENGTVTVFIPESMVNTLVHTERIGFDTRQDIGHGETLFILVEKDFQCLDHTIEDQSDMYINPNKTC
ncbi:MAG TPA: hypothetical protein VL098_07305 [Flavipsychrobacter sp.]|nr:hypothetical protein [Flavipsychrobacter sp.]